jgi:hypothetical protein
LFDCAYSKQPMRERAPAHVQTSDLRTVGVIARPMALERCCACTWTVVQVNLESISAGPVAQC